VLTIELPYLQVFLDKLYLQITGDRDRQATAKITLDALQQMGDIGDVLRNFLDDQVQENARALGVPPDTIKKLLSPFVTLDGTKEPLSADQLHARLPELDTPFIARSLQAFQNSRILRFDEKEQRYEVAHDSLARQIATYQDAEDIALQKAAQMIRTQMLLDADRREVFSEKQLLFMEPFFEKLQLATAEMDWVDQSRRHWENIRSEEERRRRAELEATKKRLRMVRGLLALALIAVLFAVFFAFDANRQKQAVQLANIEIEKKRQDAEQALAKAIEEERQRKEAQINAFLAKANQLLEFGARAAAIENLENALKVDSTRNDIFQRLKELKAGQ
jgi:hypothetical protein